MNLCGIEFKDDSNDFYIAKYRGLKIVLSAAKLKYKAMATYKDHFIFETEADTKGKALRKLLDHLEGLANSIHNWPTKRGGFQRATY